MVEEENNYIVQVFTRVNEGRKEVQEEAKVEGIDVGIKPFETVREMLEDYEKRTKNLNYFEKVKRDKEIYKEDNYSGQSVSNYTLTMEEYNKIVNFRKVYLKEQIGLLEKELNQQEQTIDNLNKDLNYKNENISKLTEQIQEQSKELEDYKTLEEMLGIDFETVAEVEKALGDIKDSKLREKVLRYATGKTPNGNNRSKEYILNKLKEYQDKQIKKDYQTMIDDILAKTVHISKRKGKEYGQVVYEDSGFFKELKSINKLSKRKAEEQLLKLNSERAEGINTEPQSHFDLKKQLLFFKSQDNIKYEFMNEILTNLGNFAKESEMMQNEIRLENFNDILDNRKEVIQAINESTMQNGITNLLSYKRYLKDVNPNKAISNIWDDINRLNSNNSENVGYFSQKPKALLERIIQTFSNEGDTIVDFFCGSGTTLVVAKELNRRYIGCDINPNAVEITNKRLKED